MTAPFSINGREIGPGRPVYVIAEMSANHGQDESVAMELVHAAHAAGADALKLQTYTPDTITIRSDAPAFRAGSGSLWEGTTLYDLYATLLHQMGLDHEQLTYRFGGRDFRLTDVHGHVIKDILA